MQASTLQTPLYISHGVWCQRVEKVMKFINEDGIGYYWIFNKNTFNEEVFIGKVTVLTIIYVWNNITPLKSLIWSTLWIH